MKIKMKPITVRNLANGYKDNAEEGVVAYGGRLNVRPPYQREFIYEAKEQREVIRSIMEDFPLNVMYWVKNQQGGYEMLDGQQRTISICRFIHNKLSVDEQRMDGLPKDIQEKILNYDKLIVYFCEGEQSEILKWFEIINIVGMKLTNQEMRNALYTGEWLADAKLFFSKTGCAADGIANKYMKATANRQEYLEAAIKWIAKTKTENEIRDYMGDHQQDQNANDLKQHFRNIFDWVGDTFPPVKEYPKEMRGVDWGTLYNDHKDDKINTAKIAASVEKLMGDDDVTKKTGIFAYVLNGDEKHLNIRQFTESQMQTAYQQQRKLCKKCRKKFERKDMEGDHIKPWSKGGKTEPSNCQMLCKDCNRKKSDK